MDNKNQLGMHFFAVLLGVAVVLLSLVISLFVIMSNGADNTPITDNPTGNNNNNPKDPPSVNVGLNNSPLFPTNPSRTSYIIGKASDVKQIDDDNEIRSKYTILVDLSSYESIAEKGADEKIYPASMTKVMTLIVACERVTDLKEKLTVTEELVNFAADNEASGAGLKAGDSYTVEDHLYLIAYKSDTVSAHLIARHIAGSEEAFVELMNQKAAELGLTKTRFANCTGLYDDNNYTTCREMAAIMAYALDNEMVYKCLSSYTGRKLTVGGDQCTFYAGWYSVRFDDNPKFTGGKIIAGKTGWIDEANTLVTCAEINGKRYINVIVSRTQIGGWDPTNATSAKEVKHIYETYS